MKIIKNSSFFLALLVVFAMLDSCKKEDIVIINRQVTPDLSNPIIQKLTGNTWYITNTSEKWTSTQNVPTPSESKAGILYSVAMRSITLYRDGTCVMVYTPPMFAGTFIYATGTWDVAKSEENTVIIATKTPVGNSTFKMKVLNLETKNNTGILKVTMDHLSRVYEQDFNNVAPFQDNPLWGEAFDYRWIESKSIQTENLQESEFIGSWSNASRFSVTIDGELTEKTFTGISYVEDLLTKTPIFLFGVNFNLSENGEAKILYPDVNEITGIDKALYSKATWHIKGNKIIINSDEALFFSVGEIVFGLPVYLSNITLIKQGYYAPIYTQSGRTFVIEVISRHTDGNWCRITTNDAMIYAFLKKGNGGTGDAVNVHELN